MRGGKEERKLSERLWSDADQKYENISRDGAWRRLPQLSLGVLLYGLLGTVRVHASQPQRGYAPELNTTRQGTITIIQHLPRIIFINNNRRATIITNDVDTINLLYQRMQKSFSVVLPTGLVLVFTLSK